MKIKCYIFQPGHHPGLRAASEMRAQQQQAGSGRGMMGIVLPMYAVGIVLYLVYTLVKVILFITYFSYFKLLFEMLSVSI